MWLVRLTSTITGKRIYASRSLLCVFASSSNRRSNAGGKMLTEERGDAKLHRLSPQLHRPPLLPSARAAAAPMRARRRRFASLQLRTAAASPRRSSAGRGLRCRARASPPHAGCPGSPRRPDPGARSRAEATGPLELAETGARRGGRRRRTVAAPLAVEEAGEGRRSRPPPLGGCEGGAAGLAAMDPRREGEGEGARSATPPATPRAGSGASRGA